MTQLLPLFFLIAAVCCLSFDTAPVPKAKDATVMVKLTDSVHSMFRNDTVVRVEGGLIFSLDSDQFHFGVVSNYEWIKLVFYARNISDHPISITRATTSCGCDVATAPRRPIMPGETVELNYTYDSHRIGPSTKTIMLEYENRNRFFQVRCNVVEHYTHYEFCYNHLPTCIWIKPFGDQATAQVKESH